MKLLHKVDLSVKNRLVCTRFPNQRCLFRGRHRCVNSDAFLFQQLDEKKTNTSGTRMDQGDIARTSRVGGLAKVFCGHTLKKSGCAGPGVNFFW